MPRKNNGSERPDLRAHFGLHAIPLTREIAVGDRWSHDIYDETLADVRDTVEKRMSAAVIGPSGAGKSGLLRAAQLEPRPPEQRWLIASLWADAGVGLIGGSPKSLKSWVGLDMAVSVATGSRCLGCFEVHNSGPALVYLAEDGLSVVRERLEHLCTQRQLDLDRLDVHVIATPALRLDIHLDIQRLDATVAAVAPKLLLLDPFVRLHRANENDAQEVAAILASLRELQRRHSLAIAVVHHTRKNQRASQHGQTLRGSGDFHAWVDSALYLNHKKEGLEMTVEHRAAPAPSPRFLDLLLDPPHPAIVEPRDDHEPDLQQRVLATLRGRDEPIRRTELRKLLAVNNRRLGETLSVLEALGRIQRTAKGWTRSGAVPAAPKGNGGR